MRYSGETFGTFSSGFIFVHAPFFSFEQQMFALSSSLAVPVVFSGIFYGSFSKENYPFVLGEGALSLSKALSKLKETLAPI